MSLLSGAKAISLQAPSTGDNEVFERTNRAPAIAFSAEPGLTFVATPITVANSASPLSSPRIAWVDEPMETT
ncbi:hypothetical protein Pan216_37460 [Planctomycetes bacterium Pan216]|uniref:Uncharacterized protein n=1 Tax=Kolteria novifilia TaxID=2527975 RepID=A0A518B7E0_9BACT|nr:hypothetical protein Pan216_37460 [Planctomycetes bacterium Pan216]